MQSSRSAVSVAEEFSLAIPERIPGFVNGVACQDTTTPTYTFEHVCPSTEEPLYEVVECDADVVDKAVSAARRAFAESGWSGSSVAARKPVLRRMIDAIEKHRDELAAIQSLEVGLPLSGVQGMHMQRTIDNFDFFIAVADTMGGHSYTQTGRYTSLVTREPVGVAALLAPWNAPLVLSSMKMAAALALGNSCVVKASEYSPWSLYRFIEILHEADIPPGLINLVNGRGAVTGKALVEHADIDLIGFVGGTATGREIIRSSANGIRKVGLELGGKSANIVLESANLESAVDGSLIAILAGNGEQCLAGSRLLVQDSIADDFIERFIERLQRVRIGDPFAPETELGPMAFAAHRQRVLDYAAIAEADGGRLLCGGKVAEGFDKGFYLEPTAVLTEDNRARVCQEEVFGPFVTIQRFSTPDHALAIANDSDYGLVSYLWSDDLPTVMHLSRGLRAGTVWVNTPLTRDLRAPFGGYRQSGLGRDGLHASVELMTEEKTVMLPNEALVLPKLGNMD